MPMNAAEAIWVRIKTTPLQGRKELQAQGLPRQESSEKLQIHLKRIDRKKGISSPHMLRRTLLFPTMNLAEHPLLPKQRIRKGDAHPPSTNVGLNLNGIQSKPAPTPWIKKRDIKTYLTKSIHICGLPPRIDGVTVLIALLNIRGNFIVKCLPATVVKGEQIVVEGAIVEEEQEIMASPAQIKVIARTFLTAIHLNTRLPCSTSYPNRSLTMNEMHRNRMERLITILSRFQGLFVLVLVRNLFHIRIRMAGFLMLRMDLIPDHLSCPAYRQTWQTHTAINQGSRVS